MEVTKSNKLVRRQMTIAVISDFLATTSGYIFAFAVGLHILNGMNSVLAFGSLQMVGPIIGLLLSGVIGNLVDHYNHKRLILISQTTAFITYLLYAIILVVWPKSLYGATIVVTILEAIIGRVSSTAYLSSVISIVPSDQVQRLSGLEQGAMSIAGIIAPILGGILYGLVSFETIIGIMMAGSVAVFIATCLLNFEAFKQKPTISNPEKVVVRTEDMLEKPVKIGYLAFLKSAIKEYPGVLFTLIFAPAINFLFSGISVMMSVLIIKQLHYPGTYLGILDAAVSVGTLIGSVLISQRSTFKKPIIVTMISAFLIGIPFMLVGIIASLIHNSLIMLVVMVVAFFILGIILMYANIPLQAFQARSIPQAKQGRVFSLVGGLAQGLSPFGILAMTGILTIFQASNVFIILGAAIIALVIIMWFAIARNENQRVNARLVELDAADALQKQSV